MKKIFIIGAFGIGICVILVTILVRGSVMLDRLNPFIKMDDYYTVVESEGEYLGKDDVQKNSGSYKYKFTGYNSKGKKQKIIINVTKDLRQGAYLKVTAKGKNGKSWEEVQTNDIPDEAKSKLEIY